MALTTLFVCFLPLHSKFFPCNDHVTDFWLGLNLHLFPKGTRRPGLVASAAKAAGQPYPSPPSDREARRGLLQSSLPRWAFSRHDVAPGAPLQSHLPPPPPPRPRPSPAGSERATPRPSLSEGGGRGCPPPQDPALLLLLLLSPPAAAAAAFVLRLPAGVVRRSAKKQAPRFTRAAQPRRGKGRGRRRRRRSAAAREGGLAGSSPPLPLLAAARL